MAKQYANFWCILFGCSVKIRRHGVPNRQSSRQASPAKLQAVSQSVSQSNQTSKQQQQEEQADRQTARGSVCEREREREGELAATGATVHNAFPVSNKPTALGQPGFPPESLMSY